MSLLDVVHVDAKLFMVFEYLDKDLKKHMDENRACGGLPSALVRSYMYQLLEGIAYCHAHQVMHRDLKPQNLLIDNQAGLFGHKIAVFQQQAIWDCRTFRTQLFEFLDE